MVRKVEVAIDNFKLIPNALLGKDICLRFGKKRRRVLRLECDTLLPL
jgi:hypothetical protein